MSMWLRRLRVLRQPHPPEWYNRNPVGKNQWTGRPYLCTKHPGARRYRKSNGKLGSCCECVKAKSSKVPRRDTTRNTMKTAIGAEFKKWISSSRGISS